MPREVALEKTKKKKKKKKKKNFLKKMMTMDMENLTRYYARTTQGVHLFLFKNDFPLKISHALGLEEIKSLK